jgi:outer membrane protein OmpA-like peptidoglycan-associated protein/tetratricopeptide (TPR) repeat protein
MNKLFASLIILVTLFNAPIHAQLGGTPQAISVGQYEKKATEAFEKKDFNKALEYYQIILTDYPNRTDLYWNTAQSARAIRHYIVADKYYELLAKSDLSKSYPQLAFYRGLTKKNVGNYDMAIDLLKAYAASSGIVSTNNVNGKDIQNEIEATEWAKGILATPLTYEVQRLDTKVNTYYTDIAPIQYDNMLYYTTAFFPEDKTKKPVTRVYSTDLSKESTPVAINSEVDGEYTAQFALNTEGSRVYYNICKQLETGEYRCEIFYREKDNANGWKESVRLPETINAPDATASQPNIGIDKATGRDVLYFVSNRAGGKGGLDIWTSDIDANGTVNAPKNLSEVNTSKDDITPYYYKDADVLFFSSEGYKSFGGLDVFYVTKNGSSWSTPVNGGAPLNSSYDDVYYSINNGRAYFTSNRKGGMCASEERDCICNDIYKYDIKVDLKAETFLASDNSSLKGCKMELIDMETGKVISFNANDMGNDFAFPLELNKKYRLIASKAGHRSDTTEVFDTKGLWTTTTLFKKLSLQPNLKLNVYVFDGIDKSNLNGAKVEMREAGSGKLIASEILSGNLFSYNNLEFGKSYWLYGTKNTYTSDSSLLTIDAYGSSMRYVYYDSLYLMAFRGGLPIVLYFDNDHPNPRTRDTFSYLTYGETYSAYMAKQPEYLRNYYRSTKEVSSVEAGGITDFFVNTIKFNYDKLTMFSQQLYGYMQAGKSFEIVVEGYASPLAPNDYNRRLTSRRISSLINHLYEFNGGVLRPYLISKTLNIRVLPFGEEMADKTVSDSPSDRRQSVYSVGAMKERKIEIKEINSMEKPNSIGMLKGLQIGDVWNIQNYSLALGAHAADLFSENGSKWTAKGLDVHSSVIEQNAKGLSGKQRHEVVMIDVYTGDVISKGGSIELYNETKKVSDAKNKGGLYRYDIQLGAPLTANISAAGYSSYSMKHFTSNTEGGVVIRDTVYLTPFSHLPLTLYFNNDRPDGNRKKDKTLSSYDKSYQDFYAQRKDFVKNFNQMLAKEGSVPSANNQMEAFFTNDVKGGFENLSGTASVTEIYLKKGYELEIIVEGYASPLANSQYNEDLTNRRIQSVVNYLTSYSSVVKKAYKSGKLKIGVRPLGETQAAAGVSDDSNDPKRSIYSIEASKERRVIVKDILIRNNNLYKE